MPAPNQDHVSESKPKQLGKWASEVAEPLIAVVAGLGLTVAGLAGWIKGDKLTAVTLLVLSVVAISLLRERSLRLKANENIAGLGGSSETRSESH